MRAVKWAAGAAAVVVALVGAAWLTVPAIVQSQLQSRGSAALGRAVRVERVEFAPFGLALTLHGLSVAGRAGDGGPPQLTIARLHVHADLRSLIELAPVVEGIEVDAPRLRLARLQDGRLDIDDIVERLARPAATPAPAAESPQRFALFNLQLRDGELRLEDRRVAQSHVVGGVQLALPFLSNLPADVAVRVEPRLAFALDGKAIELRGRALPFAPDHASELTLAATALDLAPLWAYLPSALPLRPEGGALTAALTLQFAQPAGQTPRLAIQGRTQLSAIAAKNRAGAPMFGWRSLAIEWKDLRPFERRVQLGAVTLDGAELELRRDAGGTLEWAGLGAPAPAAAASAPVVAAAPAASAASPSWQAAVERVELHEARIHWQDAAVRPAADLAVEGLTLSARALTWPVTARVPVSASARMTAGGKTVAQGTLSGAATDREAALDFALDELTLAAAAPYLRTSLRPALEGRGKLAGALDWAAGETPRLRVKVDRLQLDALRLSEPGVREPALRWASAAVSDGQLDLLAHTVTLGALSVSQPVLRLQRAAGGALNAQAWTVDTPARPARAPAARVLPWQLQLADFKLDGGRVVFSDAAARQGKRVELDLRALRVGARDLVWPASARPARVDLAAQLHVPAEPGATPEPPGRVRARGALKLAPLAWRGHVDLERWPVAVFEPYAGLPLPVTVARGELGVRGEVDLQLPAQGLKLDAKADVLVADVSVRARAAAGAAGDELMSWHALSLKPVQVAVAPGSRPRIEIGELVWSDFYSRLVISEDGRFNLRDVAAARPEAAASAAAPAAAPAVAAASASASAAAGAHELPVELVVAGTKLVNGRVDFTDRFVRPNYSAALSELNGTLGRVDSRSHDMATLELRGRAAGTALLEIRGALNPVADPLALDISARATDLELAPLSPYAGKYAGYAIERGKLSMDVAYRIDPDGKLEARNQLILNQLTFGSKVDSPDATKLPVRLAVALLTDRNGVIDLNLPISGSINDPQFSIWGIVWKLIGNLLVKAFTAPFSLLAGGATEDLSVVQFVPGTATLAPASAGAVERVAKALADRPALRMTVTGAADPVGEREAIRGVVLDTRIAAEQRRELARAGAAASAASAALPALEPAARAQIVRRIYSDTALPDKPRNLIGMAKDIPLADMERMLKAATVVSTDSARELAIQRGLAVRDLLIARGLPSERLFLGAPQVHVPSEDDAAWTPRVQLKLDGP